VWKRGYLAYKVTCPNVTEEVKDKARNGNKPDNINVHNSHSDLKTHLFRPKFEPYLMDLSPVP